MGLYVIFCAIWHDLYNLKVFPWSVFSLVTTEYGDLQIKRPYSVRIRGNADQ